MRNEGTITGRRNLFVLGILSALLAACFFLAPTGSALAQGGGLPAICDEYPNLPQCDVDPEVPDEDPDEEDPTDEGPAANNTGTGTGTGNGDGSLPFTGYPLTGLILLLLVLLVTGLVIRSGLALRDRLARGPNAP